MGGSDLVRVVAEPMIALKPEKAMDPQSTDETRNIIAAEVEVEIAIYGVPIWWEEQTFTQVSTETALAKCSVEAILDPGGSSIAIRFIDDFSHKFMMSTEARYCRPIGRIVSAPWLRLCLRNDAFHAWPSTTFTVEASAGWAALEMAGKFDFRQASLPVIGHQ